MEWESLVSNLNKKKKKRELSISGGGGPFPGANGSFPGADSFGSLLHALLFGQVNLNV